MKKMHKKIMIYVKMFSDDDYFGYCPECGCGGKWLNIWKHHYKCCPEHRLVWDVGWNLSGGWQYENFSIWQKNYEYLKGFKKVQPLSEPKWMACLRIIARKSFSKPNFIKPPVKENCEELPF